MELNVTKGVGEKLRQLREGHGFSQAEVANMVGCTREYISMIESGKRMPKLGLLRRLAAIYRVDVQWLLGEVKEEKPNPLIMLLRSEGLTQSDRKMLEEFKRYCEDYAWLESKLAIVKKMAPAYPQRTHHSHSWQELYAAAKKLAEDERGRLNLGDGPIRDIFSLLENQGLHVMRIAMPNSQLDGAFAYDETMGAFILVNAHRTKGKQVFTAAHEYCHFLKDRSKGYHPCKAEEDYLSRLQQQKELERFADLFATHFLMPEEGVRRVVNEQFGLGHALGPEEAIYLKRYFGVSYSAMLLRLRELRAITADQYEQLKRISVEKLERKLFGDEGLEEEKYIEPPKVPPMLAVLALEAYGRGFISLTRLAEIWRMKEAEVKEILRFAGYEIRR